MKRAVRKFLPALAVLLLCAGGAAFYFKVPGPLWERLLPVPEGEPVTVLVAPGTNARQIAQAFEDQGALEGSAGELARWMVRFGLDRRMQPGYYKVVRSAPWYAARQLREARPCLLRMTLIPGADAYSLREALSLDVASEGDALHQAVMDDANYPEAMRAKLPEDEPSRLAFLQPESYLVLERTPAELVRAASAQWWRRLGAAAARMTKQELHRAAVIASMVEREVLHDSEAPRVAGVIQRRLKDGMPLQIDATVVYAWKLQGRRLTRVLRSDLGVDSPYNTYRVSGLPPGPICVPGTADWDAALSPEDGGDYYYVAGKDGYHYFAKTYAEHLRNVDRARSGL